MKMCTAQQVFIYNYICTNIIARIMFQGKEKASCKCHYVYLTEFQTNLIFIYALNEMNSMACILIAVSNNVMYISRNIKIINSIYSNPITKSNGENTKNGFQQEQQISSNREIKTTALKWNI